VPGCQGALRYIFEVTGAQTLEQEIFVDIVRYVVITIKGLCRRIIEEPPICDVTQHDRAIAWAEASDVVT
jgi:hypothetical protein